MKKIATLTFHSAYNYGSVLQAYALQEFCLKILKEHDEKCDYKVINLRLPSQKEQYAIIRRNFNKKNMIRNVLTIPFYFQIKEKNKKFEEFINEYLNITKEFNSLKDIENCKEIQNFDCYISGSDQIWNVDALDFSKAYYLPFVKNGRKISYAASFGQSLVAIKNNKEYLELLKDYDYVSVREEKSRDFLKDKGCKNEIVVNVDPTLLLEKKDWGKFIKKDAFQHDYILFYTLYPSKKVLQCAKKIAKILKLPVVVTKFNNQNDYFTMFQKKYNAGPIDFLNLVYHAKFVISSSFHGTVFSILFEKPFYSIINGEHDLRIETLLNKVGLDDRIIYKENDISEKIDNAYQISFNKAKNIIKQEQIKSKEFLLNAFDIKRK